MTRAAAVVAAASVRGRGRGRMVVPFLWQIIMPLLTISLLLPSNLSIHGVAGWTTTMGATTSSRMHSRLNPPFRSSLMELASEAEDEASSSTSASNTDNKDWTDKDIYHRVFYRFSPGSDVDVHDAIVVEERCRFQADPDNAEYIVPVGPRKLLFRDGRVEDGEIGDDFFTLDADKQHKGAGNDWQIQTIIATAMYLASNPQLCCGRMLEVGVAAASGDSSYLASSFLGCIGAAFTLGEKTNDNEQQANKDDVDVLTIHDESEKLLPHELDVLTLTDPDPNILKNILDTIHATGISPSSKKIRVEPLDWRIRHASPRGRGGASWPEYRTVVASDLAFSYPEAKELARAVANRLEPLAPYLSSSYSPQQQSGESQQKAVPRFVHVCPDDRIDEPYLRRLLEHGYRMTCATHYLKMEKLTFHFQTLPKGTPETELDDVELELKDFKDLPFQCLTAQHDPAYLGEGSGELFFPMETGEYEATGGSTFLEKDTGASPW